MYSIILLLTLLTLGPLNDCTPGFHTLASALLGPEAERSAAPNAWPFTLVNQDVGGKQKYPFIP